jgi:hypothetical protein
MTEICRTKDSTKISNFTKLTAFEWGIWTVAIQTVADEYFTFLMKFQYFLFSI